MLLLEDMQICTVLSYILHSFPDVLITILQESGPGLSFEDARNVCLERAIHPNAFSRIELVYGNSG